MTKPSKQTAIAAAIALGLGLFGSAVALAEGNYESSIKVGNADHESSEAAYLSSLAKIDTARATAAALGRVSGSVLKVSLDNENGNLVYSVEIKTASNDIRDVKVDAGTGIVLYEDSAGSEQENGGDGDSEDNNQ